MNMIGELVVSVIAATFIVGCASQTMNIVSEPASATLTVNGQAAGVTPTKYTFDFSKRTYFDIVAKKEGYVTATRQVVGDSPALQTGQIKFNLAIDEAYRQTTLSDATNKWLRVQVATQFSGDNVWQRVVDSVTTRYGNLEQMDQSSGYLRSVPITKRYKVADGEFSIRTQIIGSIASREPLMYKVKIVSERSDQPGQWSEYDRVFREDGQLIEELQGRLGAK